MLAEYRRENETECVDPLSRYGMESALAHNERARIVTNERAANRDKNIRPSDLEVTPTRQSSGVNSTPEIAACQGLLLINLLSRTQNAQSPLKKSLVLLRHRIFGQIYRRAKILRLS